MVYGDRPLACTACLALLAFTLAGCGSVVVRTAPPMLGYAEYASVIDSPLPFLQLRRGSGELLYIGVEHSRDTANHQFRYIVSAWERFGPTIALSEGGIRPASKDAENAIREYGEAGLVRFLADSHGVRLLSIEPPLKQEVREHLRRFTAEQVKLFYVLRLVAQQRDAGSPLSDVQTESFMRRLADEASLMGAPRTIAELDQLTRSLLSGMDWRSVPPSFFYPVIEAHDRPRPPGPGDEFTHHMAMSTFRDRAMADRLVALVESGERVLAVVGHSHVTVQEAYLRCRIEDVCPR